MSRNGNGTYNLPAGNPVVTGTTISSTWANNTLADMANAITGSIAADGQTPITGALKGTNGTVSFAGVGQTKIPSGTTAQRAASPTDGMIRYNTDIKQYEGYKDGAWSIFGNGAGGTLFSDTVTATQGQTVITMPTAYVLGGDNLSVYVNGSRQIYNVNYTETTNISFTFVNGLNAGDLVNYTIGASTSLSVNSASVLYNEGKTGAVDRNVESKLQEQISVLDFGADPTGTTDSTEAIQAALDCIPNYAGAYCPSKTSGGAGEVEILFPEGTYIVSDVLVNNQRAWSKIRGLGKVYIYSSSPTYILDMASTYYCDVENLNLISSTANAGIYMNRCTSNPFTDYNTFNNVNVTMDSNLSANGGDGCVALYMNRCEQNMFTNCAFTADIPFWNDNAANVDFPPTNGTQDTITNSNTVNTFIQCNWTKYGSHNYAMILNGPISFSFINNYMNDLMTTTGSIPFMVYLNGVINSTFQFQFDALISFANVLNYNYYNNFDLLMPSLYLDTNGIFNFDTAGSNLLGVSKIKVFANGDNTGKYLFKQTSGSSSANVQGNLITSSTTLPNYSFVNGLYKGNISQTEGSTSISSNYVESDAFSSIKGTTASTASGTPVTIFSPTPTYSYQVYVYVAGYGANYVATCVVVNDQTTNNILSYSHGSGITITVSGANIQVTQGTGLSVPIQYRVLTIGD